MDCQNYSSCHQYPQPIISSFVDSQTQLPNQTIELEYQCGESDWTVQNVHPLPLPPPQFHYDVPMPTAKEAEGKTMRKRKCGDETAELFELKTAKMGEKSEEQNDTVEQRKRIGGINGAFAALRERIPTFPFEKRLSKIDTLNLACAYIAMLEELISTEEHPQHFLQRTIRAAKSAHSSGHLGPHSVWGTSDLLSRLDWINWGAMGMQTPILDDGEWIKSIS